MDFIKRIIEKIKKFIKWIWAECKDWRTLVVFIIVYCVVMSPVIVGYTLYFVTKNEWHLTYASVWLLFWFGPFTPLIPLCIAITFGVKKLLKIKKKRKQEKQEKEDNEKNQLN